MLYVCSERFPNVICSHFLHLHSDASLALTIISLLWFSPIEITPSHTCFTINTSTEKRRNCTILRTHNGLITARANATLINNSLGFFVPSSDGFHLSLLFSSLVLFFSTLRQLLVIPPLFSQLFFLYIFMLFFAALAACIEVLSNIHFKTPIAGQSRH